MQLRILPFAAAREPDLPCCRAAGAEYLVIMAALLLGTYCMYKGVSDAKGKQGSFHASFFSFKNLFYR